jgi:23S rRNA (guanosine2251-2'-O)-methyltransferase
MAMRPDRHKSSRPDFGRGNRPERRDAPAPRGRDDLLYGFHPVRAAWLNRQRVCRRLFIADNAAKGFEDTVKQARTAGLKRPEPTVTDRASLDRLAPGAVHQGIILDAEPLPEVGVEDICAQAASQPDALVLVLDQVTDPHNVGAILRSAAAFGAVAVVVQKRHAPEITGTLAKSASGAVEVVPFVRATNLSRALDDLAEAGFHRIGLDERGSRTIAELRLAGRVVLALGSEGEGLRRLTAQTCDELARLPTAGPIASLNVSNAAAVALYEAVRGRRTGP